MQEKQGKINLAGVATPAGESNKRRSKIASNASIDRGQEKSQPTTAERASDLAKALGTCRQDIARLIDATPKEDHHTLGILGPILAELRNAIDQLQNNA